jgi:alcohol dehydrogenase (NADP+)
VVGVSHPLVLISIPLGLYWLLRPKSRAIQRGTALLTTTKTPSRLQENYDVSTLPEDAMREINEGIKSRMRFNAVVETGVPGFIPRGK